MVTLKQRKTRKKILKWMPSCTSSPEYDIIVIGAGISGLYCAYVLSKTKRVLLIDERNYVGGRIYTHPMKYEVGAARYNSSHKILLNLIKTFNLESIKLSKTVDYIEVNKDKDKYIINKIDNSHIKFDTLLKDVLKHTIVTKELSNISFYDHIVKLKSQTIANEIVNMFGYYSEIKAMNAYDAYMTFKNDFGNIQYYVLKNGLSELCNLMAQTIKSNKSHVLLESKVINVRKKNKTYVIETCNKRYCSSKIIFATKPHQHKSFSILKSIHKYINSVYQAPLIRIYAKYPTPCWFTNINRTTTNNVLRQIIPINKTSGLIMVSYTDGIDTQTYMKNSYTLKSNKELKKIVAQNLNLVFPNHNIPTPVYFKAHLWTVGCHHWLPKHNSENIMNNVISPLKNVYTCGEGYSSKQAWMEGALESAEAVIKQIQ